MEFGKGVELSLTNAFKYYEKAAKLGHLDALTQLGIYQLYKRSYA
jgi:TPR repeat protein